MLEDHGNSCRANDGQRLNAGSHGSSRSRGGTRSGSGRSAILSWVQRWLPVAGRIFAQPLTTTGRYAALLLAVLLALPMTTQSANALDCMFTPGTSTEAHFFIVDFNAATLTCDTVDPRSAVEPDLGIFVQVRPEFVYVASYLTAGGGNTSTDVMLSYTRESATPTDLPEDEEIDRGARGIEFYTKLDDSSTVATATYTIVSTHVIGGITYTFTVNFTHVAYPSGQGNDTVEIHSATLNGGAFDTTAPTPSIAAFPNPGDAGDTATLDGSGSSDDTGGSGIDSYAWVQVTGTGLDTAVAPSNSLYVALTNADTAQATFTVPSVSADDELYFRLTVTDNAGNSDAAWVTYEINEDTRPQITVISEVSEYTNDATPDVVIQSDQTGTIAYGGSCTGNVGSITQVDTDTTITLSSDGSGTALADGTYSDCTITVTNSTNGSSESYTLTSFTVDTADPVADAAASDQPSAGQTGTLDGSDSTDTGGSGIASYAWVQVDALNSDTAASTNVVTLTNADTAQATFTVPSLSADGELYFKLTVTDNAGNSASDWVTYSVTADTTAPDLTVTDLTVDGGTTGVDLGNGITTTANDVVSWAWVQVDSDDVLTANDVTVDALTITDTDSTDKNATFNAPDADANTVYYFKVTATDSASNPTSAIVTVTVIDPFEVVSVTRHTPSEELTNSDSLRFRVEFSEPYDSNLLLESFSFHLDATGQSVAATAGASQGNSGRVVLISTVSNPIADANSVVRLEISDQLRNSAGDKVLASTTPTGDNETYTLDNTAPTVSSVVFQDSTGTSASSAGPGDSFRVVVTFSEAMDTTSPPSLAFYDATDGSGNSIDLSSWAQTASNGWSSSDTVYTFNFTAPSTLAASVAVRSTTVSGIDDAAGNALSDHTENDTFDVNENTAPTVSSVVFQDSGGNTITSASQGSSFRVVVTFSEAMDTDTSSTSPPSLAFYDATGGTGNAVDLSSWAQTGSDGWSSNDTVYTFNYTIPSTLAAEVAIRSTTISSIDDAGGNALVDHTEDDSFDAIFDTTAPTVSSVAFQDSSGSITSADPGDSFTVVVTFSETMDTTSPPSLAFYDATDGSGNSIDLSSWAQTGSDGWSSSDTVYTFNFTVPSTLATSVAVRSTTVSGIDDVNGNALSDHTENDTFDVNENTAPTVSSVVFQDSTGTSASSADPGDSFRVVVTFSEAMDTTSPPSLAFYDATGGTGNSIDLSSWAQTGSNGWSASDTVYTFNFTAPSTLAASVAIRSTTVSGADDVAGNALSDHTENDTFDVIENTAPTVSSVVFQDSGGSTITSASPGSSFRVIVTFSEAMDTDASSTSPPSLAFHDATGGTGNTVDLSSWAQTASNGWSSSDTVYTFNFTAPSTLAASVAVRSTTVSSIDDAAGNALSDHTENDTFDVIENTAPTVSSVVFQDSGGSATSADPGDSFQVVVTFSEAMDTASPPSLTFYDATGGTGNSIDLSSWAQTGSDGWSSSDTVYTFNFTAPSTLAASVAIRSTTVSSIDDAAGNALSNHTENDTFDVNENTAPTVTSVVFQDSSGAITSADPGDSFTVVVTFSEAMDTASPPSLAFYDATGGTGNTVDLSTWAQTGSNGWSSSDTVYTFNYTIPSPLAVSVAIRSTEVSSASDVAGNALVDHTEDDSLDVIENTAPTLITVAIASDNATDTSQATIGDQIALSFTASEALGSTPTVSIANTNVTPTNISGNTWVATLTVDDTTSTGLVTFTISNLVDTNSNAASDVTTTTDNSSVTIDTVAPTLTISAPAEARGSFTATFTFSEDVTGFELADITVGNGTASDFAGSDDVYTATITPTEHGDVTLDVAAAVAIDGAGNDNAAADQVSVNYIDETYVRQRTQRIISNFMTRRGDAIVSNQPDLTERLNQAGPGGSGAGASFTGEGSYANNRMAFATSLRQMLAANKANKDQRIAGLRAGLGAGLEDRQKEGPQDGLKIGQQGGGMQSLGFRSLSANDGAPAGFDLWIRGRWARYENDTNQGDLGLLFIGADYKFSNNFVLGVVAQFDWTDEVDDTDDFKINGRGWMVGPYLVAQLHQNLIFDANFSWGQSDNEVSPFNTYTDSFDGTRWLASAKFTGSFTFGNLHVAPHIGVLYFQERQEAYVDSLSIDIPEQTVKLGRLSFGPKVSTTFQRRDGTTISPYLGIKGLWDFERSAIVDLTTGLASEGTDDLRARVDTGITIRLPDGLTLNGEGFYDGLGTQDYKSYGGSIRINIPLQRNGQPTAAMKLGAGARGPTTSYRPPPAGTQSSDGKAIGKR